MTALDSLLGQRPDLKQKYTAFLAAVNGEAAVPQRIYDLCRARIQQIHGLEPYGLEADVLADLAAQNLSKFEAAEAAALVVAEKMPYQHHGLEDAEVHQLQQALGNAACVALLTALAFYDVECRLKLTAESLDVD